MDKQISLVDDFQVVLIVEIDGAFTKLVMLLEIVEGIMLSKICQILTLATCKDQIFHVEIEESGRLWQLFVEFHFLHNIEVPTMDALQFIEFETQFEPIDKKIANINIMNERKNSS